MNQASREPAQGDACRRGRNAHTPPQIPAWGWKDILSRLKAELAKGNLSRVAAGVGFYALLACIPALVALVSLYGLGVTPQELQAQFTHLIGLLPEDVRRILMEQLQRIISTSDTALSLTAVISFGLTLVSSMKGARLDHCPEYRLRRTRTPRVRTFVATGTGDDAGGYRVCHIGAGVGSGCACDHRMVADRRYLAIIGTVAALAAAGIDGERRLGACLSFRAPSAIP